MTHDRAAFLEFNRGVRRAADDYNANPTRSCPRNGCDQLAAVRLCAQHERDTAEARDRRRKKPAA